MKTTLKILVLSTFIGLTSCNKNNFNNYKYADKEAVLSCYNDNEKLISEAVYSFEEDLKKTYSSGNLRQAYNVFLSRIVSKNFDIKPLVSKHTYEVFKVLKNDKNLWNKEPNASKLNYSSDAMNCILKNLKDKNLETSFNALIKTNTMRPHLLVAPIKKQVSKFETNKKLSAYVALDLFYSKLFNVDFTNHEFKQ